MSHCKMTALALVATGALTITTMSIPASYAIDVDHGEVSQGTDAADDAQQTFIVQLEDGAADLEGVRERFGQAVAAATPGATIEYVRDYHHVFEGFALKAPRSALKAIKGVRGVAAAFAEGTREPIMYPEFLWGDSAKITNPAGVTRADQAVQQGQGLVIEVIDTGLDTSHGAFSGSMDSTSLRLTQTDMTSLTASLGAGRGARGSAIRSPSSMTMPTATRTYWPVTSMTVKAIRGTCMALVWLALPPPAAKHIGALRRRLSSLSRRLSLTPGTSRAIVTCWQPWTMRW